MSESVVYQATVTRTDNDKAETYTGITARKFKTRFYEHTADMRDERRNGTGLSNYIWELKNSHTPFNPISKSCRLCLKEKFLIMFRPEGATLNSRSEFFATCRHRLKPLIANV